ncbi:MAG: B12-binding domain-containing radical SAM protein [Nitrospirae bacterium]|nr:B12-binding domain-containing radical SAM protein [Nitrospirota bacterium]
MKHNKILLIYPKTGFSGNFTKHLPLSLLYASSLLVKNGFDVEIFDIRLYVNSWEQELKKRLTDDIFIVGISVMSGKPILNAMEIGRAVKEFNPQIKVVWGGPHATFYPESILSNDWYCDYVISGYGNKAFYELVLCLIDNIPPDKINGVSFKKDNKIITIPNEKTFEFIDYKDIPYHLIKDYSVYGQLEYNQRIFSMYSAMGCPYNCAFCASPAFYKDFGKKWVTISINQIVDHIEYLINNYNADYIYFIDDDSFVNLSHVEGIIDEINNRKLKVKLGFRGARINEIKKMSDAFINKLALAGTDILHIGAENGSNKMLSLFNKNFTVDDIIESNIKLARHPEIKTAYNFIIGIPTETLEDLNDTRRLILRLVKDNPNCIIFTPNTYRPLPGTELFKTASQFGYTPPATMSEWINVEVEGNFTPSWISKKAKKLSRLLIIGSYFVDKKVKRIVSGKTFFYKIIRLLDTLYGPIIRFRYKHGIYQGLIEFYFYQYFVDKMAKTGKINS